VSINDVGDHMKSFCENPETDGSFKTPRKYLISSMRAEKQLFLTPLLKWYMEHGLVITKVYQVIEYSPKKCFKTFADGVTQVIYNNENVTKSKQFISFCEVNKNVSDV